MFSSHSHVSCRRRLWRSIIRLIVLVGVIFETTTLLLMTNWHVVRVAATTPSRVISMQQREFNQQQHQSPPKQRIEKQQSQPSPPQQQQQFIGYNAIRKNYGEQGTRESDKKEVHSFQRGNTNEVSRDLDISAFNLRREGSRVFTRIPYNIASKANSRGIRSWNENDGTANLTWIPRCDSFTLFVPDAPFSLHFDECYWLGENFFCGQNNRENVRQRDANRIFYHCTSFVETQSIQWSIIKMSSTSANWLYRGCDESSKLSQCHCGHFVALSQREERRKAALNLGECDLQVRQLMEIANEMSAHLTSCKTDMEKLSVTSYRNVESTSRLGEENVYVEKHRPPADNSKTSLVQYNEADMLIN